MTPPPVQYQLHRFYFFYLLMQPPFDLPPDRTGLVFLRHILEGNALHTLHWDGNPPTKRDITALLPIVTHITRCATLALLILWPGRKEQVPAAPTKHSTSAWRACMGVLHVHFQLASPFAMQNDQKRSARPSIRAVHSKTDAECSQFWFKETKWMRVTFH